MARMPRVTRSHPCQICGKTDYCGYREFDGRTLWICMRESAGSFGRAANGGYMYFTDGGNGLAGVDEPIVVRAPVNRRHVVYSDMLGLLTLSDRDRKNLIDRGFAQDYILVNQYRSVENVALELEQSGLDLERVPGFWREGDTPTMLETEGFFIPVRDRRGRIQALQIRTYRGGSKYIWFSSADKPLGASSGAPLHRPLDTPASRQVWITESPLKADYIAAVLRVRALGIAGVWTAHSEVIDALLEPGIESVVIAFDGNWASNRHVVRALTQLSSLVIERARLPLSIAFWGSDCGVDDAVERGLSIMTKPVRAWFKSNEDLIYDVAADDPLIDRHKKTILGAVLP